MPNKNLGSVKNSKSLIIVVIVLVIISAIYFIVSNKQVHVNVSPKTFHSDARLKDIGNNQTLYTNLDNKLQFTYPSDWKLQYTDTQGYDFSDSTMLTLAILRPPVVQTVDQGSGTINFVIQTFKQDVPLLDNLLSTNLGQISSTWQNYQALSSEKTTLSSIPAYKIVYKGIAGGVEVKIMQIMLIKDGKAYMFTYRISPENFNMYLDNANKIFNSIHLGEPIPPPAN